MLFLHWVSTPWTASSSYHIPLKKSSHFPSYIPKFSSNCSNWWNIGWLVISLIFSPRFHFGNFSIFPEMSAAHFLTIFLLLPARGLFCAIGHICPLLILHLFSSIRAMCWLFVLWVLGRVLGLLWWRRGWTAAEGLTFISQLFIINDQKIIQLFLLIRTTAPNNWAPNRVNFALFLNTCGFDIISITQGHII